MNNNKQFSLQNKNQQHLSMCFEKVRSVRNKTLYLNDHIATSNYDIMAICETWLTNTCELDDVIVNELLPNDYAIKRVDRHNGQTEHTIC